MANRTFSQSGYGLEKGTVTLYATINIGATGAPTLQAMNAAGTLVAAPTAGFRGVKTISRTSQGLYVLTLQDSYVRLLSFWGGFVKDTVAAAPTVQAKATGTNVSSATAPAITFCTYNSAGAVTDPTSGEVLFLEIELANSGAL